MVTNRRPPLEKALKDRGELRTGHEATMLDDAQRVLAAERARTNGTDPPKEDGDMGVHVGNTVTHNYPTPVKPASKLAKVALGVAILAGGGGLGAGITALLLNRFTQPPPADTTDEDTKYVGGIRVE